MLLNGPWGGHVQATPLDEGGWQPLLPHGGGRGGGTKNYEGRYVGQYAPLYGGTGSTLAIVVRMLDNVAYVGWAARGAACWCKTYHPLWFAAG